MEYILAPSILAADFSVLGQQLAEISRAGAQFVHIDVMDGRFVPSISFGTPVVRTIRPVTDAVFDVHLMIEEPVRYVDAFADCGADSITIHYEACSDVRQTLQKIRSAGLRTGLSIKPGTEVEAVAPYLSDCDMILLMSVEPGFGGQKFMTESLKRAQRLRQMIKESTLPIDLEIDGGVTLNNVSDILDAGVNVIVSGSAVFRDPYENARAFMEILQRKQFSDRQG